MPRRPSNVLTPDFGAARKWVKWVVALIVLVVLIALISPLWAFTKTSGGEVAVVRNGGPLDNNRVRQVIQPSSSIQWTGFYSQVHRYPAQQRFYTITANGTGDGGGTDVVHVPTSDGVLVGLEGTLYFNLSQDPKQLSSFDDKFGTRTFNVAGDPVARPPYEGDKGWLGFLNQIVRPVIDNDLRAQINNFTCAQLVSSCLLVQNGVPTDPNNIAAQATQQNNNGNIAKVQQAINESLANDLNATLGGEYLTDIKFNLVRITLPDEVQKSVELAQAAFANVSKAQADVQTARQDALANEERQKGYQNCPACAEIDKLKSIPQNVTVYAPGADASVPLSSK